MERSVTGSSKNTDDDIIGLCGAGWSHTKAVVVQNINNGDSYFVTVAGRKVKVLVKVRNGSYYLTTAPDGFKPNNLDDLRDC